MTPTEKPAPSTGSGQAKPELNEIATVLKDTTYPAYSGVLRETDDTLLTRGQGKGLKLYDEIERDCTVYGDLQKRKLAVISRTWQVDAASESPLDKRAADIVRKQLESATLNFDNACLKLLPAILKGFAVGEIMWGYDGREIVATEIRPRDQRRFLFGNDYQLRLKTLSNLIPGEELPERKFIVHSFGSDLGNPYGLGLGTRLFWPAFFKRKGITFWLTFVDKFASPTPVGKYPAGTLPPDQNKLLAALDALSQSAGVTIPDGMMIELLEAARSGEAGYEKLCRYMDEQITTAILGETSTAKGGGGQAASAAITRNEVRLELVQADADLLSATLNRTLVKWITEYNVPGATPPRVWRKVEPQKDLSAVAERDVKIFSMGFRPTLEYINETYGEGWEAAPPPPVLPPPGGKLNEEKGVVADNPSFAESNPTIADKLTAQLESEIATAWAAVMTHINEMVASADSMASLQDALLNAYGSLPLEDLRRVLAQGMQVATLAGMAEATSAPIKPTSGVAAFMERFKPAIFKRDKKEGGDQTAALLKQLAESQASFVEALKAERTLHITLPPDMVRIEYTPEVRAGDVYVTSAPAQVVVAHPARSVAKHERNPETQEVTHTITEYQLGDQHATISSGS